MGKSRGGLSTRIHAAVNALGNPVRLLLTPVQGSEYGQADALIEGLQGYDSDAFVELIQRNGAEAVIPSRGNRLTPRKLDRPTYKARNLVELFLRRVRFRCLPISLDAPRQHPRQYLVLINKMMLQRHHHMPTYQSAA